MRIGVEVVPLACCAVEATAATALDLPHTAPGLEVEVFRSEAAYDLVVMVVAGTLTKVGASWLAERWRALPEPRRAVAFGVCAGSGGPYWDSYAVTAGAAEVVPVDRFVPGCPPPRATLLDAVLAVAGAAA